MYFFFFFFHVLTEDRAGPAFTLLLTRPPSFIELLKNQQRFMPKFLPCLGGPVSKNHPLVWPLVHWAASLLAAFSSASFLDRIDSTIKINVLCLFKILSTAQIFFTRHLKFFISRILSNLVNIYGI